PRDAPSVSDLPSGASGHITFGCFNNLAKVTPQTIESWADLLRRVRNSRLIVKATALEHRLAREYMRSQLAECGVSDDRFDLLPPVQSVPAHLQHYAQ